MAANKKAPITIALQNERRKTYPTLLRIGRPSVLMHFLLTGGLFGEHAHGVVLTPLLPVFLSYFDGLSHRHSSSEIGECQPCQR